MDAFYLELFIILDLLKHMEGYVLSASTCLSITVILAVVTLLKKVGLISSYVARKMVHVSVGICQMLFMKYYGDGFIDRIWAISAIALFLVVFFVFGTGKVSGKLNDFLVSSVCRSNNASEMQKGPMYYCISLIIFISVFWRNYPPAIMGMMVMITGDGLAEVVGKAIPSKEFKNPWNETKTLSGICAVMLCGAAGSIMICYHLFGNTFFIESLIAGLIGALVEFYSPPNLDNLIIPVPIICAGYLFM